MKEREQTLELLMQVGDGAFATPLLESLKGELRDVNFIRTLLLGVLRWRLRLDYVIEQLARRRVGKIDRVPLELLRMGMYQLMFMEVPAYAAVSETVELTTRRAARAKGFVNAVMRKATDTNLHAVLPQGPVEDLQRLAIEFSHPEWLVSRWLQNLGGLRTKEILESNQKLSHPDLLVNELRISLEAVREVLVSKEIAFERSPIVPNVLRIEGSTSGLRQEIAGGLLYPMDEASVLVASMVDVQHGAVLDMTAAPGGKSLAMALRGGAITSNDVSPQRLSRLRRLHAAFIDSPPQLVVSDGRASAFRQGAFHSILLDAPCSATGTIRKSPEIKWRLNPEAVGTFAALQTELLAAALDLEPQLCVYSTCSLEPEENDAVVARVLGGGARYEVADAGSFATPGAAPWIQDRVLRITPESGTDGFTAFVLKRNG